MKTWKATWEGKSQHELLEIGQRHESSVNALAMMANGLRVCSGGADRVIHVWRWGDCGYSLIVDCSLKGHGGPVLCMVNVKGFLISGSSDMIVRIWGFGNNGSCLAVLACHSRPIKTLVGVPEGCDGLTIFSRGLDGEIKAWQVSFFSD